MEAFQEAPQLQSPLPRPRHHLEDLLDDFDLHFPRVHADQEILDFSSSEASLAMRPQLSRHSSDTASSASVSSLDDSTYDLVSITDGESEDGNHSESLASVDGDTESTLDDASIVTSPYNSDRDEESDEEVESHLDTEQQTIMNVEPSVDDSGYTARTLSASASTAYLNLVVSDDPSENQEDEHTVNVVCDIEDLHEPNTLRELCIYNSPQVGLSLNMAIKQDAPLITTSFRLLVVAHHRHFTSEIAEHIKRALLAGHPYDNLPDMDLTLMQCVGSDREFGAYQLDIEGQPAPVLIAGNHMYMKETEYSLPTLAVFLHPSLADVPAHSMDDVERHFTLVRHAMQACQVPILDLSEHAPLFRAAPYSYTQTPGSMHLRVSTLDKGSDSPRVVDMLPVDLDKFLRIEPRTVNAHLACIIGQSAAEPDAPTLNSKNKIESSLDVVRAWYKQRRDRRTERRQHFANRKAECRARIAESQQRLVDGWREINVQTRTVAIASVMTILISLLYGFLSPTSYIGLIDHDAVLPSEVNKPGYYTPSAVGWFSETLFRTSASVNTATSVMKAMHPEVTASKSSCKPTVPRKSSVPEKKVETGLSKTAEKSVGQHFSSRPSPDDEPSPTFNVDVVDGSIVLKPNRTSMFGHLYLRATVSRNEDVIKADVKPGPDGSYTIEVPHEDAHGLVNVTIRWGPGHSQVAEVDMGSTWLKASTWSGALSNLKQTVKEPFAAAQANTHAISVRVATGLSKFTKVARATERVATTKATFWKSITDVYADRRLFQAHENSIPVRLGRAVGGAHATALTKWYDAVETINSVNIKKTLLQAPVQAFNRGKENGRDLGKVIGGHASNIWKGCLKESTAGLRCGLSCLNARAEACARRKAEAAAAAKNTGPRTIGEKHLAAKKVKSKAKVKVS